MPVEPGATAKGKKARGGLLILMVLIALTIALILASYHFYDETTGQKATVLKVTINVSDGRDDAVNDRQDPNTLMYLPYIQNASSDVAVAQDSVRNPSPPGDSPLMLPGVVVHAFNADTGASICYWNSKAYDGPGTYDFILQFIEMPSPGTSIKIVISINDSHGDDLFPYFTWDLDQSSVIYVWQ